MLKKAKVLVATDSMHIGCGVREVVLILLSALVAADWDVSFIGAGYNPGESAVEFKGVKSHRLHSVVISKVGMRMALFFLPWALARIFWEAFKTELIIVESNSTTGMASIVAAKIYNFFAVCLRLRRKRILFHAHTQADEYLKHISIFEKAFGKIGYLPILALAKSLDWLFSRFLAWIANSGIRGFMNCSDYSIAPTEFFIELMVKRYGGKFFRLRKRPEAWTAPLSISKNIKPYPKTELYDRRGLYTKSIPYDWPLLVYLGRIGKEKGTDELLALFGRLHLLGQKVGLVIIGGGDVGKYRQMADSLPANAGRYASFFDRVPHDEAISLISVGDDAEDEPGVVGVSYSTSETQGIAIDEQMACGLPVIVKENTCFALDVSRCNGGQLITGNPEESAHLIIAFLGDKAKMKECGKNGQAYVRGTLSRPECVRSLLRICSKVYCGEV